MSNAVASRAARTPVLSLQSLNENDQNFDPNLMLNSLHVRNESEFQKNKRSSSLSELNDFDGPLDHTPIDGLSRSTGSGLEGVMSTKHVRRDRRRSAVFNVLPPGVPLSANGASLPPNVSPTAPLLPTTHKTELLKLQKSIQQLKDALRIKHDAFVNSDTMLRKERMKSEQKENERLMALEEINTLNFINGVQSLKISEMEDSISTSKIEHHEKMSSRVRKHKDVAKKLQEERIAYESRANLMIQQMTEQMALLQQTAMDRIAELENELMTQRRKYSKLESESEGLRESLLELQLQAAESEKTAEGTDLEEPDAEGSSSISDPFSRTWSKMRRESNNSIDENDRSSITYFDAVEGRRRGMDKEREAGRECRGSSSSSSAAGFEQSSSALLNCSIDSATSGGTFRKLDHEEDEEDGDLNNSLLMMDDECEDFAGRNSNNSNNSRISGSSGDDIGGEEYAAYASAAAACNGYDIGEDMDPEGALLYCEPFDKAVAHGERGKVLKEKERTER